MKLADPVAATGAAARRASYDQALRAYSLQMDRKERFPVASPARALSERQLDGLFAPRMARLLGLGAPAEPPLCPASTSARAKPEPSSR